MKIANCLVVITGGSSGIGAAVAEAIAQQKGRVILLARTAVKLEQVVTGIVKAGGQASYYPVDLAEPDAIAAVAKQILTEQGTPQILINNAGVGQWLRLEETSAAEAQRTMAVPYFAAFNLTREFLPAMERAGQGHIVNITSPASYFPFPGAPAYIASRAALAGLTNALRVDLYGTGIGVSLVGFGSEVEGTGFFDHNPGNRDRLPKVARYFPPIPKRRAVEAIIAAIEHNQPEVMVPWLAQFSIRFYGLFPRLLERIMAVSEGHNPHNR